MARTTIDRLIINSPYEEPALHLNRVNKGYQFC